MSYAKNQKKIFELVEKFLCLCHLFSENEFKLFSPGSKSAVIALIAGSTTKGMRKRKAKTERIAVVPMEIKKTFS